MTAAAIVALVALLVWLAVREFLADARARDARAALEAALTRELEHHRARGAQLERMLDEAAARALQLAPLAQRDTEILAVARGSAAGAPAPALDGDRLDLAIDQLPEVLARELRAIDGDGVQREYLDTIAQELARGADPTELAARLFAE